MLATISLAIRMGKGKSFSLVFRRKSRREGPLTYSMAK